MNRLISISYCSLLKKTLVITTNLTNPESASVLDLRSILISKILVMEFLVVKFLHNLNLKQIISTQWSQRNWMFGKMKHKKKIDYKPSSNKKQINRVQHIRIETWKFKAVKWIGYLYFLLLLLFSFVLVSHILLLFHSPKGSWNELWNMRNSENNCHNAVNNVR